MVGSMLNARRELRGYVRDSKWRRKIHIYRNIFLRGNSKSGFTCGEQCVIILAGEKEEKFQRTRARLQRRRDTRELKDRVVECGAVIVWNRKRCCCLKLFRIKYLEIRPTWNNYGSLGRFRDRCVIEIADCAISIVRNDISFWFIVSTTGRYNYYR